jgi:S1-C subfamily serine protease
MNTAHHSWISIRHSLRGPVGWLVLMNVIVYGFLLARILASLLSGSSTSALLLNGLNDQISRLEIIADGPCNSMGMQQFQRGEIGPIFNLPQGVAPLPPATNRPAAPAALGSSSAAPTDPAQVPGKAAAPPGPSGEMLNPEGLRLLVHQSVVRVLTDKASGTGFAIGPSIVVTNRHVIEDSNPGSITVTSKFLGNEPVLAKLLFTSPDSQVGNPDFAVLELQGGMPLVPLMVGSEPMPLDNVVAAGFPSITVRSDIDEVSPDVVFSQGEVSVVQPQSNGVGLVIHTASIAPGSSGGPLINRCGTIVGVNTFVGVGEQAEGRALYALSPVALAEYLSSVVVAFRQTSSECVSGGG